jgi:spore coat polysaccharide biosynthesis protein SpsF
MEVNTILITQARTGSTRLPGKVLMEINGTPLLKTHLDRLSKAKNIDLIIVATTETHVDDFLAKKVIDWGYEVFRGSENDVLDRFYMAVKNYNPEFVVRVTSDCPLIDPELIDKVVEYTKIKNKDYCANIIEETFPDGQDIEVFKFSVLKSAWKNSTLDSDREHVTPYIRNNTDIKGGNFFTGVNYSSKQNFSQLRMTVDEAKDFELIKKLINDLGTNKSWQQYSKHIIENDLNKINEDIIRNEGYLKSLKNDQNG